MGVPKRKISSYRKGKRLKSKIKPLPGLVICKKCKNPKPPHRRCKFCFQ